MLLLEMLLPAAERQADKSHSREIAADLLQEIRPEFRRTHSSLKNEVVPPKIASETGGVNAYKDKQSICESR
jgi:hypothetical protein